MHNDYHNHYDNDNDNDNDNDYHNMIISYYDYAIIYGQRLRDLNARKLVY